MESVPSRRTNKTHTELAHCAGLYLEVNFRISVVICETIIYPELVPGAATSEIQKF